MKNDLMTLFSDQLHWFARLKRKQRFCVLYFCMSFGISVRLLKKHVPLNDLED